MRSQAIIRHIFKSASSRQKCLTASSLRFFSEDESIHSKDIAFKPAESGWGAGKKYEQNYDNIFKKKEKKDELPKGENTVGTTTEGSKN